MVAIEVDRAKAAFDAGYRAGANSAFAGYDGGWSLGEPYVIVLAKLKPALAPPLPEEEARVPIPAALTPMAERGRNAFTGLLGALGGRSFGVPAKTVA